MYSLALFVLVYGLVAFNAVVRCSACDAVLNLALDKPAFQSSTYRSVRGFLAVASGAVDGNTATNFNQCQSCTHTDYDVNPAWWMVDLQKDSLIERVEITSRGNYVLRHIRILVGREYSEETGLLDPWVCAEFESQPAGSAVSYPCATTALGRFVMVERTVTGTFMLCEVKVYGPLSGPQTGMCQKRFSQAKKHSLPKAPLIMTANVTGLVECAELCDATNKCHVFAVETLQSALSKCYLYECVGTGFVPNEMANVYTVIK